MGVGKFSGPRLGDLGQGHLATEAGRNLPCPHDKVKKRVSNRYKTW